jgi:glycosyltransferase involved in cell wall biosynthesis
MKKMRIIHLISSLNRGGAETVLATLLEEWGEPLHEHTVLYFHEGPLREHIEKLGIKTIALKGFITLYDPLFIARLVYYIQNIKPHIIYSSLWAANFLGRIVVFFLRIPIICAVHALPAHEGRMRNILDRWCPINPTRYIAVAENIKQSLIAELSFPAQKIQCITNGIMLSKKENLYSFPSLTGDHFFGNEYEKLFIIGTVGRLVPVKNYDLLLTAFAQLCCIYDHVRLMIVGYGPEEERLKELAKTLMIDDKVSFILNQPAAPYYAFFDCFVQPSTYEGLSMALLESLLHELPAIVVGRNHMHEVIEHGETGLVIISPEKTLLVEALITLLKKEPQELQRMGSTGRACVENFFSSHRMVQAYRDFIKNIE